MSGGDGRQTSAPDFDAAAFAAGSYADWSAGVRTNMVMSLDGAVSFRGRVGPLSSAADRALFYALRALSDVVLVGAATARVENYGPVELSGRLAALRAEHRWNGAQPQPRLAIVTASCRLPRRCLGVEPSMRPIVITSGRADTSTVGDDADVIVAGADEVDLPAALAELAAHGLRRVLCEGGPTLIDRLAETDLIDELCVTLTPQLTAEALPVGNAATATVNPFDAPHRYRLRHAVAHADDLFLRYTR
ncbi:pyrimidine reductase family protein [Gordonia sp. DT219]|uniref:pyrimidine reductase family protein n=1 Tax=Gordonia sp. DT219 TaxID=3416658 RepID=UPI003CEDA4A6